MEAEKTVVRFDELNLSEEVQRAITEMGYEEASPIQAGAIPVLLEGRDVIGQAQTGTGKTAAFSIPIIEAVDADSRDVQAIVLCPTRELAVQVSGEIQKLGKHKRGLAVVPIYGGSSYDRQFRALERGVQIVIGTPGRVMDHIERGTLKLDKTTKIILDEADEMLDMGFREDIEYVLSKMPEERQTVFFSATMSKPIMELTKKYQRDPQLVKVNHQAMTVNNIEQSYFEVRGPQKKDVLTRVLDMYNLKSTFVFANTKRMVDEIVADLQAKGYFAEGLHGDMGQQQRQNTLDKFRKGTLEVLVATDVAARGIDVDNVEAVFNYDLPADEEYYVHRIGRTGRAGKSGRAFTFVSGRDIYKLRDIMRFTKAQIKLEQVPSFADVSEVKTTLFLGQIKEVIEKGNLEKYVGRVQRLLDQSEDITSLDIAAALLKMTMKEDKRAEQSLDAGREKGAARPGFTRLFVTMGKKDRIHPRDIVDLISESTNLAGAKVGDIALYDKFSFVEVPSDYADEIVSKLGRTSIQGSPVSFSIATPVQEGEAKQEGNNRGPGGFGGDRGERRAFGGERREGGYGGGYKGNRGGFGGERREGGYGGGYKGNRDGGSGYGNRPSYGERREGGYGKSGYGNKGGYGDRPSYGNKPNYGTPREYDTTRAPRTPRNESFDE
ncbi:DEAD/DEAH box helicase [Hymenobacter properus]|uniref:DEAD-box ATP-dependent RNA helicase RhpA n=1 Tax=Hymenobacter properus TaxID=2791026 RepID=A0A931FGW9_9BACT|nr:DEAD/DEAH box helicase [Hymenobacter properus]MBF9140412.1 DEAD/DEAH box helicase [Hymenobacter properus]MBR7719219.1 DEAD/DEAH box helicase [Microvirga sp. SRT04]